MNYLDPSDSDYVLDDEIEDAIHGNETDARVLEKLRGFGVKIIQANYSGGSDQSYYGDLELLDENEEAMLTPELQDYLDDLEWNEDPAVIAVDEAHGGYFSGAGDGSYYGGTVQMRLDTLQTREIHAEYQVVEVEDRSDAAWGTGVIY